MRISQKADYAVRAIVDLALHSREGAPARVTDIAKRARVPVKFLEAIVVDLRKAGLVASRRGPDGGHTLAVPASEITLGQVLAAIEGPLHLVEAARGKRAAQGPMEAGVLKAWKEVESAVSAVLDGVTVESLCRRIEAHDGAQDFCI